MSRNSRRRGVAVLPSMAPVSPTPVESGRPRPRRSTNRRNADADPAERYDPRLGLLAREAADPDPRPQRWPKLALVGACLAVLAAGWWLYRDDVGDHGEKPIAPLLAAEVPTKPRQATTFEELLEKERRVTAELDQKLDQLSARENGQQSLAQAHERIKELEQQLAASRQPPPAQQPPVQQPPTQQSPTSPAAANDRANEAPVYRPPDPMPKPQPSVRRSGPRPLPKATQPMPRLSLQASGLDYNPAGYWQVTATLVSNTSHALDARVQCSFLSAGRPVDAAEFGPMSVAPGERVSIDLIGPPTTAHLDSTTCRLAGQ